MSQVAKIQELMRSVMQDGQHYGVVPGTDKPTLLKAGAEKLGFVFRLVAEYDVKETDLGDGHREYRVLCTVKKMGTGEMAGQGVGICSTMESKYRYRNAARKCPACGAATIIKGKEEYGGGWLCWKKKGGCGAAFQDGDQSIEGQPQGKIDNPDIADVYNTVLKIGKKRAHVDAMITSCAASDIFTQDIEEMQPEPPRKVEETGQPETTEGSVKKAISRDPEVQALFEQIGKAAQDKDAAKKQCIAILETQLTKADVMEAAGAYLAKLQGA
jgi:hypothetical protein